MFDLNGFRQVIGRPKLDCFERGRDRSVRREDNEHKFRIMREKLADNIEAGLVSEFKINDGGVW